MKSKMNWMKLAMVTLGLAAVPSMFAQTIGTTTLGVTIAPEANITTISNPTLTNTGSTFNSFTGSTTFTYYVRTTTTSGSGTVTAEVTTPFAAGSNIPTANLSQVVSTTGVGTANTTPTAQSTSGAINVLTFGAGVNSSNTGDAGTISWTLLDKPSYATGTYSTVVTLTISAS
jgi:hypothetical protein